MRPPTTPSTSTAAPSVSSVSVGEPSTSTPLAASKRTASAKTVAAAAESSLSIQEALSFFEHLEQLNALASANAPSTAALLSEANPWATQQAWLASNAASTQVQVLAAPLKEGNDAVAALYPSGVEALGTPQSPAQRNEEVSTPTPQTKATAEATKPLPAHLLQAQAPFWQQLLRHEALNDRLGHGAGQGGEAQRQPNSPQPLEATPPAKGGLSARMVQWLEHSGRKGQPIRVTVDETLSLVLRISQGKVRAEFISAQGQHMAGLQAQVSALYQQLQQQKLPVASFSARSERREETEARQQPHGGQDQQAPSR